MQVLSRDQVNALLEVAPDDTSRALYALAATTGLRRGELLGLKWTDVNFEKAQLTVQRTAHRVKSRGVVMGEPKTAAGRRTVRLGAMAVSVLKRQRSLQLEQRLAAGPAWDEQGLLFANTMGMPLDAARVTRKFQDTLYRAGLPKIRFHDLRHTAATLLIEQGVTLKAVQATMGHSTIATTMDVYAHVTPAMQDSVAEAMDRIFGESL